MTADQNICRLKSNGRIYVEAEQGKPGGILR